MTEASKGKQAAVELVRTDHIFTGLEAALFDQMMQTSVEEAFKREKLFYAIKALRAARSALMFAAQEQDIENYTRALEEAGLTSPRP